MSKKQTKPVQEADITVKTIDQEDKKKMPEKTRKSGGKFIANLSLLISLAALAGIGYIWLQMQALQQSGTLTTSTIQENKGSIELMQHEMVDTGSVLKQQQTDLSQQASSIKLLQKGDQKTKAAWVLDEVEYHIRLAIINLQFNHDPKTALSLLQIADQRLKALADPALNNLRQNIATDISQLKAIELVDEEGLLARLNAITSQFKSLPMIPAKEIKKELFEKQAGSETKLEKLNRQWQKALRETWRELQTLITVRHLDKPIAPLLNDEERVIVFENMILQVQQAKLALLQGKADLYESSLQAIAADIKHYFAANTAVTKSILAEIEKLKSQNIKPELPDITGLLKELNKIKEKQ